MHGLVTGDVKIIGNINKNTIPEKTISHVKKCLQKLLTIYDYN